MSETVLGADQAQQKVRRITPRMIAGARRIIARESTVMASHVRDTYLTGGTAEDKLAVRTGALRASTRAAVIEDKSGAIDGGVTFGTIYARMHVGPRGQVTTVLPKNKKFLTIPLPAALTPAGVLRGGARSPIWGETFVMGGRNGGPLLIAGKRVKWKKSGGRSGAATGTTDKFFVPLFLLVKQVQVKARVHPEEILAWEMPRMIEAFRAAGMELSRA